jgi:very-short-patch-repair endonuclease
MTSAQLLGRISVSPPSYVAEMDRPPLAQLFEYADRRLGVFTTADARRLGVTKRMLEYRSEQRVIERVHRGVYRVVGAHENWRQQLHAATLHVRRGGTAVGLSAAALHRFDGFPEGPIDVVGVRFDAVDLCHVGVIRATTPVRTIIDLAALVDERSLVRALDSAERDGKVKRPVLVKRLAELGRRRGTAALRRVLERREAVGHTPRTVLERALLDAFAGAALPTPICQYRVVRADGVLAYLDFALPDVMLAIEVDGNASHATPAQRAADNDRTNALPGWRVLRFTCEMRTPETVASTVARNLTLESYI